MNLFGTILSRIVLRCLVFFVFSFSLQAAPGGGKGKSGGGGGGGSKSISAKDDYLTVKADSTASINVIKNSDSGFKITATHVNGSLANNWVQLASSARVYITDNGDLTYDPHGAFDDIVENSTDSDSFTYMITDKYGQTATATVHVTIDGVKVISQNQPPVVEGDTASLQEDSSVTIDVLSNDFDPDGDSLSVSSVGNPQNGAVLVQSGLVIYTPNSNFFGVDTFAYSVSDGNFLATSTVNITVNPINDAPIAISDKFIINEGSSLSGNVLSNDKDVDGDTLSILSFDQASRFGGTVSMAAAGDFSYLAAPGFIGTDTFRYLVTDGYGEQALGEVEVLVEAADSIPYYIKALLPPEDWYRFNYPSPVGTTFRVTYAFAETLPTYLEGTFFEEGPFYPYNDSQKEAFREILAQVSNFSGLTFEETTVDKAMMITGFAYTNGVGFHGMVNSINSKAGDFYLPYTYKDQQVIPGERLNFVMVHELGHALGLGHLGLEGEERSQKYSAMTSHSHPTYFGDPSRFQLFDVAALQYLYGANKEHAIGDNTYVFSDLNEIQQVIWDGGGHDKLDLSNASYGVSIDLRVGHFSTVSARGTEHIAITFGTTIEDAIGSAYNDRLTSNEVTNHLTGGSGADVFAFASDWGDDRITDFVRGVDVLDFTEAGLSFSNFGISSSGGNTILSFEGNTLIIEGVQAIDESDFVSP